MLLAQALHSVRAELTHAESKLKVVDEIGEAQALEASKDFAGR
jgi:hypothetical protein